MTDSSVDSQGLADWKTDLITNPFPTTQKISVDKTFRESHLMYGEGKTDLGNKNE